MLLRQSAVAEEFAPLLLKDRANDFKSLISARVGWSSFSDSKSRCVFLARCLPYVLFARPVRDEEEDDDVEDELAESGVNSWLKPIAETCLHFLTHKKANTIRGAMSESQSGELVAALRRALRRREFSEPYTAPPLRPGQLLQTLFPAHRLNAFHRMLHDTKR